jgi:protein TonB
MISRYPQPFVIAVLVTLCLFYLMQALVMGSRSGARDDASAVIVDFTRSVSESELQTKDRSLPEKTPPPPPPTLPELALSAPAKPVSPEFPKLAPRIVRNMQLTGGLELSEPVSDTAAVPLVRIEPRYPRRAQARGIEGWVRVMFTISPTGTVDDARIIAAEPERVFDAAALRAVAKWKYKPRIVEGRPVAREDVEVTLRFEIED